MAACISAACRLYLYSLLLEAVTTSPDPELIKFASNEGVGAPAPCTVDIGKSNVCNRRIVKAGTGGFSSFVSFSFKTYLIL